MITLDAQNVADAFPSDGQQGGAQMFPVYRSNGGYYNVQNNPVYVQLAYSRAESGGQGQIFWTQPAPFPTGPGILAPGTVGIRFRNYTAGLVAVVSGSLSENGEPPIAVTSSGSAAAATLPVTCTYAHGPVAPGALLTITAPATGTFIVGFGAGTWNSGGLGDRGTITSNVTGTAQCVLATTAGGGGSVFVPGIALTSGQIVTVSGVNSGSGTFSDIWAQLIQTA